MKSIPLTVTLSSALTAASVLVNITAASMVVGGGAEISNLASELKVSKVGDAFHTPQGIMVCLELQGGGWIGWHPSRPAEKPPASPRCEIPQGSSAADPLVDFAPAIPNAPTHRDAAFQGASSIVLQTEGDTHCGPILPTFYSVTFADGSHRNFYVIVRLREPRLVHFDASCDFAGGKSGGVKLGYDVVTTLDSLDSGNGATILYAWNDLQESAVLLSIRELPTRSWSDNGSVFVVPQDLLRPKLDAAGGDPRARYRALLSVIGSVDESKGRSHAP